jgi:hypothetical protein
MVVKQKKHATETLGSALLRHPRNTPQFGLLKTIEPFLLKHPD